MLSESQLFHAFAYAEGVVGIERTQELLSGKEIPVNSVERRLVRSYISYEKKRRRRLDRERQSLAIPTPVTVFYTNTSTG